MLKLKFLTVLFFAGILCCCTGKYYPKAENALDAGREFIDGCLKGDFDKVIAYMVNDETNKDLLLKQKKNYDAKTDKEKQQYKEASIVINEDATVNDSTHIINYKNSYDNTGRKVKVILSNNEWLVDFKYTFDGNL